MSHCLKDIEKKQNICLPKRYKQLYESGFSKFNGKSKLKIKEDIFYVKQFLTATEIIGVMDEFYDFWGYDIVPIAELEYGDYICLYYCECRKNPIIIYWNYELALENPNESILPLFNDIELFEIALQ